MAHRYSPKATASRAATTQTVNLAYKPFSIGAVIVNLLIEQKRDKKELANFMNLEVRTIERWFTYTYLSMPELMKVSEFFQKNLVALYHPNVKDEEHPLTAMVAAQKKEMETLKEKLADMKDLQDENLRLEGKVEELERIVEKAMRR